MGCSGNWLLRILCLLYSSLHNAAVRVTMSESSLDVVQGDSVTMPCSFFTSGPLSRLNIIWTVAPFSDPHAPSQVIAYDHGQVLEDPSLNGRVGFAGIPFSADIILNDTRVSDAGTYRCLVSNPPETGSPGVGELALSVLAPPSLPVCLWAGDTGWGGSVTLSCTVAEGIPTPDMRWDKLEPAEEVSLPMSMDGDLSASVQIINLSTQDSGVYRCSVSNLLGTQNCYVNLSVFSPAPDSSPGVLQGVLLTLAMALVLLALLVLVLWLHRSGQRRKQREGKEEECYNEISNTPSLMKRSFV